MSRKWTSVWSDIGGPQHGSPLSGLYQPGRHQAATSSTKMAYRTRPCWTLYLTHCGLVTLYSDIHLGQNWLRYWLVAWWHQAITWTSADLPLVRSRVMHLGQFQKRYLSRQSVTLAWKYWSKMYFKSPRGQRVNPMDNEAALNDTTGNPSPANQLGFPYRRCPHYYMVTQVSGIILSTKWRILGQKQRLDKCIAASLVIEDTA